MNANERRTLPALTANMSRNMASEAGKSRTVGSGRRNDRPLQAAAGNPTSPTPWRSFPNAGDRTSSFAKRPGRLERGRPAV